jgi:hypothetical protein
MLEIALVWRGNLKGIVNNVFTMSAAFRHSAAQAPSSPSRQFAFRDRHPWRDHSLAFLAENKNLGQALVFFNDVVVAAAVSGSDVRYFTGNRVAKADKTSDSVSPLAETRSAFRSPATRTSADAAVPSQQVSAVTAPNRRRRCPIAVCCPIITHRSYATAIGWTTAVAGQQKRLDQDSRSMVVMVISIVVIIIAELDVNP